MKWTDDKAALLGTKTDGALAAELGTTPAAVQSERRRRKIPPFCKPGKQPRKTNTKN